MAVRSDALPGDTVPDGTGTLIPVLPFGGIVLGTVTNGIEIRGNLISNNGRSNVLPANGIFVLNGEAITIADNRVINNGGRALPNATLRPGVRSGIAVMLAGSGGSTLRPTSRGCSALRARRRRWISSASTLTAPRSEC